MNASNRGVRNSADLHVVHVPLRAEPSWCIEITYDLALDPFAAFVMTTEEPNLLGDPHWRRLLAQHLDQVARAARNGRPRQLARIRAVVQRQPAATLRQTLDAKINGLPSRVRRQVLGLALRGAGRRPRPESFRLHDGVLAGQRDLVAGPAPGLRDRVTSPPYLRPIESPLFQQPLENAISGVADAEALVTGRPNGFVERTGEWGRVWQAFRRVRNRVDVEVSYLRAECSAHEGLLGGWADAEGWSGLPMPTPRELARAATISLRWRIASRSPTWS